MDILSLLKSLIIALSLLLFLIVAYKTRVVQPIFKALIFIIIELMIFIALGFAIFKGLNIAFKKVKLVSFKNTIIGSTDKILLQGCVKNVGKYRVNSVTLHVKIINNATRTSRTTSSHGRKNRIKFSSVVIENLALKSRKCFAKSFKYPTYFRYARIIKSISID